MWRTGQAARAPRAFPALLTLVAGCIPDSAMEPGGLSPIHDLAGTWSTTQAVEVIYQTNACEARQAVGKAPWHITWTVTAVTGFTNVVDVVMRVTPQRQPEWIGDCGLTGWVPYNTVHFRLCVDGTRILRCSDQTYDTGYAYGSFTKDQMMLTWYHWECLLLCFGEFTAENALGLFRRS